jgi:hypothetical protein
MSELFAESAAAHNAKTSLAERADVARPARCAMALVKSR